MNKVYWEGDANPQALASKRIAVLATAARAARRRSTSATAAATL